jgi:hypothetical protein
MARDLLEVISFISSWALYVSVRIKLISRTTILNQKKMNLSFIGWGLKCLWPAGTSKLRWLPQMWDVRRLSGKGRDHRRAVILSSRWDTATSLVRVEPQCPVEEKSPREKLMTPAQQYNFLSSLTDGWSESSYERSIYSPRWRSARQDDIRNTIQRVILKNYLEMRYSLCDDRFQFVWSIRQWHKSSR